MKKYLKIIPSILSVFFLVSCGSSTSEQVATPNSNEAPPLANDLEGQTFYHVNQYRVSKGLPRLQSHPGLTQLAREHSSKMYQRNEMDHFDFLKRSKKSQKKYGMGAMSENLHRSRVVLPSGSSIANLWANSPKHKKNMAGNYTHAGLGMKQVGTDLYTTLLLGEQVQTN